MEISNAATFLAWRGAQPSMVLHELAHAFHDLELQEAAGRIAGAMVAARERGNYRSVLRASGARDSHYAMTNAMEYFAETTEALLGVNDFYPFVRAELLNHDPEGARLVAELWGAPELAPAATEGEDRPGSTMGTAWTSWCARRSRGCTTASRAGSTTGTRRRSRASRAPRARLSS